MIMCLTCAKPLNRSQKKYCSVTCQKASEYNVYIRKWKAGEVSGIRGINAQNISMHLVHYLLDKYNNACSICQWHEINESTGRSPLEIDHIDGDADNNDESNLRLLCPNCHSLTPNYKNLNKGNGRLWRREKYAKIV